MHWEMHWSMPQSFGEVKLSLVPTVTRAVSSVWQQPARVFLPARPWYKSKGIWIKFILILW